MHRRRCAFWLAAAALAFPALAPGHGEQEPGPHGGEIRMPGAFHVEAVARDGALLLYLLDMDFESPRVEDSSVAARLEHSGERIELDCGAADTAAAFHCPLPDGATLERGVLLVDATRDGMAADTAEYELPLAWAESH